MSKAAKSVSIIGGADGPTSIFLIGHGKEKNILKRMKMEYWNRKYKKRRRAAEKTIVPGAHTMDETIRYMKERYGAVEADDRYPYFAERKINMKCSLIQKNRPELIGGERQLEPPDDLHDQKAVEKWMKQIEEWTQECHRKAEKISDEVFPSDYHMLIIERGEKGRLEIEIDTVSSVIGVSYSGDKKVMEPILKDIYLFYGVSQEDIDQKSERYKSLAAVLSD